MPMTSSCRENGEIIISSGSRLTIDSIADFVALVREGLHQSNRVAIEFEPEMDIDVTGIQAVCSACKSAAAEGKVFSYYGQLPQALTDMISICGTGRNSICKQNNDSTCLWFGGATKCQS